MYEGFVLSFSVGEKHFVTHPQSEDQTLHPHESTFPDLDDSVESRQII